MTQQRTHIFWSKRALQGGIAIDGTRINLGYIDQAVAISRNPEAFTKLDIRKAINVLKSNKMPQAAQRLAAQHRSQAKELAL